MILEIKQYQNLNDNQKKQIDDSIKNVLNKHQIDDKGTLHADILDLNTNQLDDILIEILKIIN